MLPLNFNHLYYFYVVAIHSNVSRAAEELRISQSSISVQVKQLENSLGRTLFNRIKTGVELTESGQVVFQYAERVFSQIEDLRGRLEEMDHVIKGSISVGTVNSVGIYMLPDFLKTFHSQHPEVKISIEFQSPRELVQRLVSGRLDFAVLPSNRRYDGLNTVKLTRNKLFLVAPPDHPLAAEERVSPSQLSEFPFLGYEEGMEIRMLMDGLFRRMSLRIEYVMESSNVATIKHMVLAGLGLAMLPETAVGDEIRHAKLKRIDMPSLYLFQDITVCHKTNRALSPAKLEFFRMIKEQFAPVRPLKP
jgi:DNA-binding transcriptional LysR family regulator